MTDRERALHRRVLELAAAEYPGVALVIVSEDVAARMADDPDAFANSVETRELTPRARR